MFNVVVPSCYDNKTPEAIHDAEDIKDTDFINVVLNELGNDLAIYSPFLLANLSHQITMH